MSTKDVIDLPQGGRLALEACSKFRYRDYRIGPLGQTEPRRFLRRLECPPRDVLRENDRVSRKLSFGRTERRWRRSAAKIGHVIRRANESIPPGRAVTIS